VFAGTMWSPEDILNRLANDQEKKSNFVPSKLFKFCLESVDGETAVIRVPLLDEEDVVTCDKVMSTKEALDLQDTTDEYLFSCVYQQKPIAPSGLEFAYDNLSKFKEEPLDLSTYAYAVLDPARKGKDNVSMPIGRVDEEENHYIVDVLFKKEAMSELYDEIVDKIILNKVVLLVVESNIDVSLRYVIETKLKEKGYGLCEIREKYATTNKEQRISAARGIILRKLKFKDKSNFSKNSEYGKFIENLTRYSFDFANKHDDAPDSCALYSTEIILGESKPNKVKAVDRRTLGF
jgi:predicted phage terminase large subunit-like protein